MNSINVIVLNGQMGSGKDTIGMYLKEQYHFCPVSIAEPLYLLSSLTHRFLTDEYNKHLEEEIYKILFNLLEPVTFTGNLDETVDKVFNDIIDLAVKSNLLKAGPQKPRVFLQDLGTLLREANDAILIMNLGAKIEQLASDKKYSNFIITDLRTKNEIYDLKDILNQLPVCVNFKFINIKVSQENIIKRVSNRDNIKRKHIIERLNHKTEEKIDANLFDEIVDGNQSKEETFKCIESIVKTMVLVEDKNE